MVGGGPAGSSTAIALRQSGLPVIVLDQARFPRDKVCGDVILPQAQDGLRSLGLDLTELASQRLLCTGARYHGPDGRNIAGLFHSIEGDDRPWWMIRRSLFDAWLLNAAARSGAEIRQGWRVESVLQEGREVGGVRVRNHGALEASAVVGADGAASVVARSVGLMSRPAQHVCLAARAYVRADLSPEPYLEVFTTAESLPGCAWIVPVAPGEFNVGAGIVQSDAQRLQTTPQQLFRKMLLTTPAFSERLRGADIPQLSGWVLPSASQGRKLGGPGFLLAGDAGAMVDPFTGHGIHHALHAGQIAARVIAYGRVDAAAARLYEASCRAAFLKETSAGYWLQRIHSQELAVRLAVRLIGVHQGLRRLFLSLIGHTDPRQALLRPREIGRALLTWR